MMVLINDASLGPVLAAARRECEGLRQYVEVFPSAATPADRTRLAELSAAIAELAPFVKPEPSGLRDKNGNVK